jgi:hypothetical protein
MHWRAVGVIAKALLLRGAMSGDEIVRILRVRHRF